MAGEARNDGEILAGIYLRLREMYAREGGAVPEQVLNMSWDYLTPENPASEEVAMESNGGRWRISSMTKAPCW